MAEMSLDLIGISEGTDKHSLEHDYLRHYERLFEPYRTAPVDVVEIGVAGGASLRTWRRFFTQARIVGIDIHPHCRQHADEKNGVIVEIGSQDDPGFLTDLCQRYRPSIIIDDGSHLAHHMQFSFERLFPALLPGGCYAIEDMPFHFGQHATVHTGTAATPMPDYIARLAFGLLGEPLAREASGLERYFVDWIDRIEIIGRLAVFWKKVRKPLTDEDCASIEAALLNAGRGAAWGWYCGRLIMAGLLDRAAFAARRGEEILPGDWTMPARLAQALEISGDLNGALRAVERSLTLARNAGEIEMMRGREASLKQRGAI